MFFSGGVGSWMAAKRVVARHGPEDVTLLFADVKMEDEDLYRFIVQAAADVGVPLTVISAGMTPWELFHKDRFLGNSRVDLCSKVLKRNLLNRYRAKHFDPEDTVCYFGIDWTEKNRLTGGRSGRAGLVKHPDHIDWHLEAPLIDPPYLSKADMFEELRKAGIELPRLYEMGFPHNNCGGFCIKAGQAHFVNLMRKIPERYAWHEEQEQNLREKLGKDVTILKKTIDGERRYITLREFREMVESDPDSYDKMEWGGCGCAL